MKYKESNCHSNKCYIWSLAPKGAGHQDELADWPSVVMWLRLRLVLKVVICIHILIRCLLSVLQPYLCAYIFRMKQIRHPSLGYSERYWNFFSWITALVCFTLCYKIKRFIVEYFVILLVPEFTIWNYAVCWLGNILPADLFAVLLVSKF
jgi:hypothetical protein